MPCEVLTDLYFTLVHPYFKYCNVIWAVNRTVSLESLFRMQKRAIRVVSNSKWNSHSSPLVIKMNVLTLYHVIQFQTCCFMHKIHNHILPINFQSLFNINYCIHDHNTRRIDNFHVISHRTNVREYSIKYMV